MPTPHSRHWTPAKAASIDGADRSIDWQGLESLAHRDPAQRGLASFRVQGQPLDAGQLRAAAMHLAEHASAVGIVTGFCAIAPDRVASETDGPPGALFLARALTALGIEVLLISDSYTLPLLAAGCDLWQLDHDMLVEFPWDDDSPDHPSRASNSDACTATTDRWVTEFFASARGQRLSHLISIERPGPSHTLASLAAQSRGGPVPRERFLREVPANDRDVCHNMRGESIHAHTAKTHRLFEWRGPRKLPLTTIGIGDGGNEIGMGRFAWEVLVEAIGSGPAGRIVSRVATDYALLAGVSDWGAYALALAVVALLGQQQLGCGWNEQGQRALIETLVRQAGAVDGLTLRPEPTVDGLVLDDYLQPLAGMRGLLGYEDVSRSNP